MLIQILEDSPVFKESFDLGCLPKLRFFVISYLAFTPSLDFDSGVDQICYILHTHSPAQSLTCIEIDVSLVFDRLNFEYLHPEFEKSSWLTLDSLLTSPQYPSLRKLDIMLRIEVKLFPEHLDQSYLDREIRRYFSLVLPALFSSKSLKFTFYLTQVINLDGEAV
jgi:hypothetical protein